MMSILLRDININSWFRELCVENIPANDLFFESLSRVLSKTQLISKVSIRNCHATNKVHRCIMCQFIVVATTL